MPRAYLDRPIGPIDGSIPYNPSQYETSSIPSIAASTVNLLEGNAGNSRNNECMSVVRKNFCRFVFFDFTLVCLIWWIVNMITGNDKWIEILKKEIVDYTIETSQFDMVVVAVFRLTVLLLFYGVLRFDTKFFVIFTTAGTCVFLIIKALYFNWNSINQPAIQCISLLTPFLLASYEVWLLYARDSPNEQQIRVHLEREIMNQRLIQESLQSSAREKIDGGSDGSHNSPYYSPIQSDDEDDESEDKKKSDWLNKGVETMGKVKNLLSIRCWNFAKKDRNSTIYFCEFMDESYYKVEMIVKGTPTALTKELYENIQGITQWNTTLQACTRIDVVSPDCDILHQVTKKRPFIAQRDLVIIRKIGLINNLHVIAFQSVTHPGCPEVKNVLRAHCGVSCWIIQEHSTQSDMCEVIGIISIEVSVKLVPKHVILSQVSKELLEVATGIRKVAEKLLPS